MRSVAPLKLRVPACRVFPEPAEEMDGTARTRALVPPRQRWNAEERSRARRASVRAPGLRCRFARVLIESVQMSSGGRAMPKLRQQLPAHVLRLLTRSVLTVRDPAETLELEAAVELLLAVEQVLSGGSGQTLRRAAAALSARVLAHGRELVAPGQTVRTLKCLQAPFEQPFVNTRVIYDVQRTPTGFTLEVGLPGHTSSAPVLGAFALGYAQSAIAFSGDHERVLGLSAEPQGDRVCVVGRLSSSIPNLPRAPSAAPERPLARSRTPAKLRPSLFAQVDRILNGQASTLGEPSRSSARGDEPSEPPPTSPPGSGSGGSGTRRAVPKRSTNG